MDGPGGGWKQTLVTSALAAALATVLALATNALRADGLALVRHEPFEILVPCPELKGKVESLTVSPAELTRPGTLLVDARSSAEYGAWHAPGALNVPFDFLDPVPEARIKEVAATGARRILVYGDGGEPDSGRELAAELAGRGLRSVWHLRGGAAACRRALAGGRP
jgi:rhodanese-related sulfurtransferase